jgi:hypothetical protein
MKNSLFLETIFDYPRKHRPYSLVVNASTDEINGGLRAMLCQRDAEREERLIAYASRQLVLMQTMEWALDHFDTYLRGRQFADFTDHKPLETHN